MLAGGFQRGFLAFLLQALAQLRVALGHGDGTDRMEDGLFGTNENQAFFRPGDAGVDQVPLQHHIVRHQHGHHDDGIFAALGLVDGGGVGKDQLVQLRYVVLDAPVVEADRQRPVLQVHPLDDADVAVEDFLFIVVPDLHDLVALPVYVTPSAQATLAGVYGLLQELVEVRGADHAALHRGEDLNLAGTDAVIAGELGLYQLLDGGRGLLRRLPLHEEKVGVPAVGEVGHLAAIDAVGVHDDTAGLRLAEDPGQTDNREAAGVDDIPQDIPGPHAGQLVDVAHQDQRHAVGDGLQKVVHQHDVDHRAFVHNQDVPLQRVFLIPLIALGRLDLQKAVDGFGLHAGGLGETLRRAPRGGGEQNAGAGLAEGADNAQSGRGLAGAGSAGEDKDLACGGGQDGLHLDLVVIHPRALLDPPA